MTVQQLSYFIVLGQCLHFGRAAKMLYIAQATLSHSIAALEEELNVTLFDRDNRKVALTPAGQIFLQEAMEIVNKVNNAVQKTRMAESGYTGSLSIGTLAGLCKGSVADMIYSFTQNYPHVSIAMSQTNATALNRRLIMGEMDIALTWAVCVTPFEDQIAWRKIDSDRFSLVLGKRNPLADREFALRELADEPFVVTNASANPFVHDHILRFCEARGLKPKITYSVPSLEVACTLIKAGLGVGIFPALGAMSFSDNELVCKPIDGEELELDIVLSWNRKLTNPVVPTFLENLNIEHAF